VICLYVFEDYIDSGLLSATPKQIKIRSYRGYKCAEKYVALLLGGGKILLGSSGSRIEHHRTRLWVCGTPGMICITHEHSRYLCRGGLKYASGICVPDSRNSRNSTQVVAEYNEFKRRYPGRYFEVSGPALRCTTETYKAGWKHLPGGPGVRRDYESGDMIGPLVENLEIHGKRTSSAQTRGQWVEGGRERHICNGKGCLHIGYSSLSSCSSAQILTEGNRGEPDKSCFRATRPRSPVSLACSSLPGASRAGSPRHLRSESSEAVLNSVTESLSGACNSRLARESRFGPWLRWRVVVGCGLVDGRNTGGYLLACHQAGAAEPAFAHVPCTSSTVSGSGSGRFGTGMCYRTKFAGLVSAIGSLTRNSVRPGCDSKSMVPSL
jgi:hypothetical protein